MYSLILALVLSSPVQSIERNNVTVDGKDCKIKTIVYDNRHNYIYAVGNCQVLYDMCTKDFCKVRKHDEEEIFYGNSENVGEK